MTTSSPSVKTYTLEWHDKLFQTSMNQVRRTPVTKDNIGDYMRSLPPGAKKVQWYEVVPVICMIAGVSLFATTCIGLGVMVKWLPPLPRFAYPLIGFGIKMSILTSSCLIGFGCNLAQNYAGDSCSSRGLRTKLKKIKAIKQRIAVGGDVPLKALKRLPIASEIALLGDQATVPQYDRANQIGKQYSAICSTKIDSKEHIYRTVPRLKWAEECATMQQAFSACYGVLNGDFQKLLTEVRVVPKTLLLSQTV